ncbi:uncharacterized protein A1O9_11545 [Exophiala aquamarina CBS 119918]|uniref:carnosine N-methyltransferase n=1 Tax=Exophiala aquamarina CBS 119918 TaxID=1182545 RepID=A0A072P9V5_9EURO|nr:uncharacterized protein A1O9_11545 [Exophiala aquamarina CBS 119918]KEF52305.1 hypothetical protein A1O9_11545 [Exophiala aquamarina CBS 119918]
MTVFKNNTMAKPGPVFSEISFKHVSEKEIRAYRTSNEEEFVSPRLRHFLSLPPDPQEALCQQPISCVENIKRVGAAVYENSRLALSIADYGSGLLSCLTTDKGGRPHTNIENEDAIVRSTLRQLYRDFSQDGSQERGLCHKTIIQDLARVFAGRTVEERQRILVPGAGLLRLPLSLQLAGYEVEANEHERLYCRILKPSYNNAFDAVTTLFFIDTARNLLDYITAVNHCLKPGGIWINIGPLLWNCYENGPAGRQEGDVDDDLSCKARHRLDSSDLKDSRPQMLEFSNDEVLCVLEYFGFVVEVQNPDIGRAGFIANPRGMLQNTYQLSHWVARKEL